MSPYEKLDAWAFCHELVLAVYAETRRWPSEEKFGLTSQARRSAVSAATNIAEGAAKRGPRELRRFLDTSIGSLSELEYLLRLALDLKLIAPERHTELRALHSRAGRTTWRLYQAVSLKCT
jgi:four helix bundle protein